MSISNTNIFSFNEFWEIGLLIFTLQGKDTYMTSSREKRTRWGFESYIRGCWVVLAENLMHSDSGTQLGEESIRDGGGWVIEKGDYEGWIRWEIGFSLNIENIG